MATYDYVKLKKKLQKELDEGRYEHTLGVMYTCSALAMAHGEDLESATIAGLMHDCAKCIPNDKKLKLCEKYKVDITRFEKEHPFLIHAKLGAVLAEKKYGITDSGVLSSIASHTTGKPGMTRLEEIVYIADYIEPLRDKAPNLDKIRPLAFQDLDECMYEILKDTLEYLDQNPKDIDPTSRDAFLYYKNIHIRRLNDAK